MMAEHICLKESLQETEVAVTAFPVEEEAVSMAAEELEQGSAFAQAAAVEPDPGTAFAQAAAVEPEQGSAFAQAAAVELEQGTAFAQAAAVEPEQGTAFEQAAEAVVVEFAQVVRRTSVLEFAPAQAAQQ